MYRIRLFAIRHSRSFEWIYKRVEQVMIALDPVLRKIGYDRVERPIAFRREMRKDSAF